jgi:hypothetical protein
LPYAAIYFVGDVSKSGQIKRYVAARGIPLADLLGQVQFVGQPSKRLRIVFCVSQFVSSIPTPLENIRVGLE